MDTLGVFVGFVDGRKSTEEVCVGEKEATAVSIANGDTLGKGDESLLEDEELDIVGDAVELKVLETERVGLASFVGVVSGDMGDNGEELDGDKDIDGLKEADFDGVAGIDPAGVFDGVGLEERNIDALNEADGVAVVRDMVGDTGNDTDAVMVGEAVVNSRDESDGVMVGGIVEEEGAATVGEVKVS